ncbi:phosphoribosyl-AMP cyclohydrolase [Streptomyces sp. NPDC059785]|uniref:phosphoribosyl-AMP cyclohydrolase n=1 Tax=Streptomyces sp. NPDC059785 TaxID=3346945 RepID=UPI00365402BA
MTSTPPPSSLDPEIAARLKRSADGLVPAIAQQYDTGEVLMLGWMDDEALHRTLTTGRCTYWSRSRREYWVKGDTSGHVQHVKSVALDCDADTLLVQVDQVGAACHTGARTCFEADVLTVTGPGAPEPGPSGTPEPGPSAAPEPGPSAGPVSGPVTGRSGSGTAADGQ